jgi:hypothetical protein
MKDRYFFEPNSIIEKPRSDNYYLLIIRILIGSANLVFLTHLHSKCSNVFWKVLHLLQVGGNQN